MMKTSHICVLLSAYNGEQYISSQLDSILNQEGVEVRIIVRDDESTDNTVKIVEAYRGSHDNITIITGKNVGFIKSFTELVQYGIANTDAEIFCFADQDDIWYHNKLQIASCTFTDMKEPQLFCSNSDTIDSDGKRTGIYRSYKSNWSYGNPLYIPTVQGCSMVFNKRAAELYTENPPNMAWHDHWMFLICHFLGSVTYHHSPLFAYRIHSNSTLGNVSNEKGLAGIMSTIRFWFSSAQSKEASMAEEFLMSFDKLLSPVNKKIIVSFIEYKTKIAAKWYMLSSGRYTPSQPNPSLRQRLSLLIRIITNKL